MQTARKLCAGLSRAAPKFVLAKSARAMSTSTADIIAGMPTEVRLCTYRPVPLPHLNS
jgi:hypothetical protein